MATFHWQAGNSGAWNAATSWVENGIPNGLAADVVIDAAPLAGATSYTVKIAAGVSETVHSLNLGGEGTNLEVDGTLTFDPTTTGALGFETGSSALFINGGTVVNAGLIFASIHTTGNVLFSGVNPLYVGWELQVVNGTATLDTASLGPYDASKHILFDGIYEALGAGRTINLGGKGGGLTVDAETLSGPKSALTPNYWTQLIFDDPGSQINEWNGTGYVSVESTLKLIENSAYVTVTGGRGYATSNALTIGKDGVFEQAGGTLSTGGLTLQAGGLLIGGVSTTAANPSAGRVTVQGAVANNGQIVSEGAGLVFRDALSGTGQITFNRTAALPAFGTPVAAAFPGTLEVGAVGAGQTVVIIGNDTLVLDAPAAFAGTVAGFDASDKIVVDSTATVTGATYTAGAAGAGTLTLSNGAATLGTVRLTGDFSGKSFQVTAGAAANSYEVTVKSGAPASDPLFDATYYLAHNPDVVASGMDPYQHYLTYGWHEGRNPNALFDTRYYLAQNPDVAKAGVNPLLHFEANGWREGRNPSLLFSDAKYLAANPDVAAAHIDPLEHYITHGQSEGRMAFLTGGTAAADPLVNAAYYDQQLGATLIPVGAAGQQQAAASYDATGWQRGLNPDAFFNTKYYLSHNPDVAAAHVDPLLHYEKYGWHEGRDPSAQFSTAKYLAAYSDVKASGLDPLLHYVAYGQSEGRTAFTA